MVETIYAWFKIQITDNQIFSGLVGASLIGSLTFLARGIPKQITTMIDRLFSAKMTVSNDKIMYYALDKFLAGTKHMSRVKRYRLYDSQGHGEGDGLEYTERVPDEEKYLLAPGTGTHLFFINKRIVLVRREIDTQGSGHSTKPRETLHLSTIGVKGNFFKEIASLAAKCYYNQDELRVLSWDSHYWRTKSGNYRRGMDTIFLVKEQKERVIADMGWFLKSKDWYKQRGIPYHRGYLFAGPPGTGKTSLAQAIAAKLDLPIYMCSLAALDNDKELISAFNEVPANSIILLEDLDACMPDTPQRRKQTEQKIKNSESLTENKNSGSFAGISLSGLLNVLDGVVTPSGVIIIMTTNFPKLIDSALLRPGRVDIKEELGPLPFSPVLNMFNKFYPEADDTMKKHLESVVGDKELIPANLQEIFIRNPHDPNQAIKNLESSLV